MLLSDKERRVILEGLVLGSSRSEAIAIAQLKKVAQVIQAMPHGTTHCDILQSLLEEVK